MRIPSIVISIWAITISSALLASTLDLRVDLESPFLCEVQGDNTLMRLDYGFATRRLEVKKTNSNETQLDEFEVDCVRTDLGLKCSDHYNIAQVSINAADIHESCPFWKDECKQIVEGKLTYRQRNFLGLRATKEYKLECQFTEI